MAFWKWLTRRPSIPDLGNTRDGAQHGLLVCMDGKSYRLRRVEKFSGTEHSQVKLTFISGYPGDGFPSWRSA